MSHYFSGYHPTHPSNGIRVSLAISSRVGALVLVFGVSVFDLVWFGRFWWLVSVVCPSCGSDSCPVMVCPWFWLLVLVVLLWNCFTVMVVVSVVVLVVAVAVVAAAVCPPFRFCVGRFSLSLAPRAPHVERRYRIPIGPEYG